MESLSDIVAEMRRGTKLPGYWRSCDLNGILKYHADRIEAIANRERAPVGNAAAMRDAMVELTDKVLDYLQKGLIQLPLPIEKATAKARAALSAPARQCDVGTAEGQAQRFHNFCVGNSSGINGMCKPTCPCIDCFDKCLCLTKWAQTPYAEEGDGDGE